MHISTHNFSNSSVAKIIQYFTNKIKSLQELQLSQKNLSFHQYYLLKFYTEVSLKKDIFLNVTKN